MLPFWLPEFHGAANPLLIVLAAMLIDALIGDPKPIYDCIPHPVKIIGRLIGALEGRLNKAETPAGARSRRGMVTVAVVVTLGFAVAWAASLGFRSFPGGWAAEAVLASTLIAANGLHAAVSRVRDALVQGIGEAQQAVAAIAGRDPGALDSFGITRTAVESAAENFSDGVVAPVLWYAVFGLPGLVVYKTINTLDSMIGHDNERFGAFGRSAALLDDAANWLPARLSGALITVAAMVTRGADAVAAWHIMKRDAVHHRSPNAGWPEAAMAGALGVALGGPRQYGGEQLMDPWIGEGNSALSTADINRALVLYVRACIALAVLVAVLAVPVSMI